MNKEELKDTLWSGFASWEIGGGSEIEMIHVPKKWLFEHIDQLDEPEKVVVPAFVAEWYEKENRDLNRAIYHLCNDTARMHHTVFDDFKKWFVHPDNNSIETLIKMQNGYTVEEKKYYVKEPITGQFLIKDNQQSNGVKWVDGFSSEPESYTEKEIKDIDDRFWAFAVPVEELEE